MIRVWAKHALRVDLFWGADDFLVITADAESHRSCVAVGRLREVGSSGRSFRGLLSSREQRGRVLEETKLDDLALDHPAHERPITGEQALRAFEVVYKGTFGKRDLTLSHHFIDGKRLGVKTAGDVVNEAAHTVMASVGTIDAA